MAQLPPSVQMYGILSTILCQLNKKSHICEMSGNLKNHSCPDVVSIAEVLLAFAYTINGCAIMYIWDGSIDSIKADRVGDVL